MPDYFVGLFGDWRGDDDPDEDIRRYLKHLPDRVSHTLWRAHPAPPDRWYEPEEWATQPAHPVWTQQDPRVIPVVKEVTMATVTQAANPAVTRIAKERGVSVGHAYRLYREEQAAKYSGPVPTGQRIAVMRTLINNPKAGADAPVLLAALHEAGVRIDMHDTVKTLWALQKMRWVRFREAGSRSLYAIKVTDHGLAGYSNLIEQQTPDQEAEDNEPLPAEATPAVEDPEPAPPTASDPPVVALPWFKGSLGGFPVIRDIRDRWLKSQKLATAAKLLEEAGEDDMALTLMGKIEFTDLENEVLTLLRHFGEIE